MWAEVWRSEDGSIVAEIQSTHGVHTIRTGNPYSDPPPADDPDDTLANVTYWTPGDIRDLFRAVDSALPFQV